MSDMRDPQIRAALVEHLRMHAPAATVRHEMVIRYARGRYGEARADVVAIDAWLHGYEIKSDRDSRVRLPGQVAAYDALFDFNTLVCAARHVAGARVALPAWWGILVAESASGEVRLREERPAMRNGRVEPASLARQLHKGECIALLRANGVKVPTRTYVHHLWPQVETLPLDVLRAAVRASVVAHGDAAPEQPQLGLFAGRPA